MTRHLENYPGIVVWWSAVNVLFEQDGVGKFGQTTTPSQELRTAEGRSDGPVPSIVARNRSLETLSGKYKRSRKQRYNRDTVV